MILLAAAAVPLIGVVGLAADTARAYTMRSRLIDALDQAALAAGRARDGEADRDMRAFFNANFQAASSDITLVGPTLTVSSDRKEITLTANAVMPTTFLSVLGIDTMEVAGSTTVRRSTRGMELALVMDNTNSMKGNGGMAAMKPAAIDLLDILFGNEQTIEHFWVSIVPFTVTANVGSANQDWVVTDDGLDYGPSRWKGCVEARHKNGRDRTDDPPSVEKFVRFFYPRNKWDNRYWMDSNGNTKDGAGKDITDPPVNEGYNEGTGSAKGPNLVCPRPITPLVKEKSRLVTEINALSWWPARGGTMINQGIVWGWNTLSPRWRGLWRGADLPDALPLDYGTRGMDKVMVILTDGKNDWANQGGGAGGQAGDYTAYGRKSDKRLAANVDDAIGAVNTRTAALCANVKQAGIIVYTILFAYPNDQTIQTLMRNCASSPANFFNSPTAADLRRAFRTIGTQLSDLRIAR